MANDENKDIESESDSKLESAEEQESTEELASKLSTFFDDADDDTDSVPAKKEEPSGDKEESAPSLGIDLSRFTDDYDDESEDGESQEEALPAEETASGKRKPDVALRATIISLAVVLLAVAAYFFYTFVLNATQNYILTYKGVDDPADTIANDTIKPSIEELKFAMIYGDETETLQAGYDRLVEFLVVENAARKYNITLTAEERLEFEAAVADFKESVANYGMYLPQLDDSRLADLLSLSTIQQKVSKYLFDTIGVDRSDFESELENFVLNGKMLYYDVRVKYVLRDSLEAAEESRAKLIAEDADTDEIIKSDSYDYSEEYGIDIMPISEISQILSTDQMNHLVALPIGGVSEVLTLNDGALFAVFIIDDVIIPSDDEIEELFTGYYNYVKENELFASEFNKMKAEADITPNDKLIAELSKQTRAEILPGATTVSS
ncbi:hypothetical protein FACS1894105_02400 [Clostridia bacterium]|nr:hypothetical protein FACS1894105_02310 [Clostridia bacterium]GHU34852.1 hypothetical protein FACS1894105_02400 [Clostridia bacterium]